MFINNKKVGHGEKCFIIAEIAQAHDGSLGAAHSYIDATADAGADAIKFQTHIAEAESTVDEPFRIKFSYEDETRFEYWKRMEFSLDQWKGLAKHARQRNLIFMSSPFSTQAVELLLELDICIWKIGSGEAFNPIIINRLKKTNKPILISSGMCSIDDVIGIKKDFDDYSPGWALFQCTTMYPTPLDKVGLNVIDEYRALGVDIVGLSDHSGVVFPAITAISRNVDIIEVHVNFDKRMFGPDSVSSLTFNELETLVKHAEAVHLMNSSFMDKNEVSSSLSEVKNMFTKGLIASEDMVKGHTITIEDLDAKKPCTGISVEQIHEALGKKLIKDITKGDRLYWDILDAE